MVVSHGRQIELRKADIQKYLGSNAVLLAKYSYFDFFVPFIVADPVSCESSPFQTSTTILKRIRRQPVPADGQSSADDEVIPELSEESGVEAECSSNEDNHWTADPNLFCPFICGSAVRFYGQATKPCSFFGQSGPSIMQCWEMCFPPGLLKEAKDKSNLYAHKKGLLSWKDLELADIKLFFSCLIQMGISHRINYRDCWSTHPRLHDRNVSCLMSRKKIMDIKNNLYFGDLEYHPTIDSSYYLNYKITPFLNPCVAAWKRSWNPSVNIAVDESVLPFKRRHPGKIRMPDKPHKDGFKVCP